MSLMAPLHRQYKTARTETRRHLLLKIWQMPTQTSASRGYVFIRQQMAFMPSVVWCRKGHTKVLKLSAGLRTQSVECSKLEKTRIIEDANIRLVRNFHIFEPNFHLHFHMKSPSVFHIILLITQRDPCLLRQLLSWNGLCEQFLYACSNGVVLAVGIEIFGKMFAAQCTDDEITVKLF